MRRYLDMTGYGICVPRLRCTWKQLGAKEDSWVEWRAEECFPAPCLMEDGTLRLLQFLQIHCYKRTEVFYWGIDFKVNQGDECYLTFSQFLHEDLRELTLPFQCVFNKQ